MYKIIFVFVALFTCSALTCLAQKKIFENRIYYEMATNFNGIKKYKCQLDYNNEEALYTYKSLDSMVLSVNQFGKENQKTKSKFAPDTTTFYVFSSTIDNKIYRIVKGFDKKKYVIIDSPIHVNWAYKDSVKTIGKYKCMLATGKCGGRIYEAWFTEEIPCSFGPWKLNGLPGAVLECKDQRNEVFFSISKIESKAVAHQLNLGQYTSITMQAYKNQMKLFFENQVKILNAKMKRGFNVSIGKISTQELEIYED